MAEAGVQHAARVRLRRMDGTCIGLKQLELFCSGCRSECDQKCVIDDHEVEILQAPVIGTPHLAESCCSSVRASFCTPRREGAVPAQSGQSFALALVSSLGPSSERSRPASRSAR
uniref:Uncharacterized protein n=1 Tax=Alexandrium monilatum TaxID=311494 RepID=A0A7S4UQV6_9DINO